MCYCLQIIVLYWCFIADSNEGHPGNKENKRKHSSSHMPVRTKRERKFPGPAGLLPDRVNIFSMFIA